MKPYYDHGGITIYLGDCREILPELEADLVLTDPPYNARDIGVDSRHYENSAFPMEPHAYRAFCQEWFSQAEKVTSRLVFTPGIKHLWEYPPPRWVACWSKPGAVSYNGTGGFNIWEPILIYGQKSGRFTQDVFTSTPLNFKQGIERKHPCPKPESLFLWLVNSASKEGDTILDPFVGSGTTLITAKMLQRRAIGIEKEEYYCEMARRFVPAKRSCPWLGSLTRKAP